MILWGTLQLVPEGLRAMVRAHDGAFFGDLRPEGRTLLEKFMDVSHGRDPTLEQEKSVRSCPPE